MHRRDGESVDRMASKTRPINPHAAETMMAARGVRKRPQWADFEADIGSNAIDCWWQNAESYEKHLALGTSEPPPPPAPCQGPAIDCIRCSLGQRAREISALLLLLFGGTVG